MSFILSSTLSFRIERKGITINAQVLPVPIWQPPIDPLYVNL